MEKKSKYYLRVNAFFVFLIKNGFDDKLNEY